MITFLYFKKFNIFAYVLKLLQSLISSAPVEIKWLLKTTSSKGEDGVTELDLKT